MPCRRSPEAVQLSLCFDDSRNRPPAAPPTPEVIETLADLLLAAVKAMQGGPQDDAHEDHG